MTSFRFIHASFPNPALAKREISARLASFRRGLLAAKKGWERPLNEDGIPDPQKWLDLCDDIGLSLAEQRRIDSRAERLSDRHSASTGLQHLRMDDMKKLEVLRHGVRLAQVATEHQADELAASLHAEFPWMGPATEAVWHGMRRSVKAGDPGLRLPPLLLDGPPGIGKSAWSRALGDLIGAPTMAYEASVENASFGLVGSQRSWGNANPGRLLNMILAARVGNPVVVVDEIEKSGRATSSKGQAFSLTDAMLPLLEPISSSRWSCPYFEVKFDMSFVIWILTSNDCRRLPAPLLSRCPPIHLREVSIAELVAFAQREGSRRGLGDVSIEAVGDALVRQGASVRPSLRTVMRMLERAATLEDVSARLH
jgi:hypothetical protein